MVGGRGLVSRTLRLYLPLAVFLVAMLFPFYWMLITSIKPNSELYNARIFPLIVYQPTLQHYIDLLTQTSFLTWTYNTMLVAVISTAVSLVLGVMIAYPLARMRFHENRIRRLPQRIVAEHRLGPAHGALGVAQLEQ